MKFLKICCLINITVEYCEKLPFALPEVASAVYRWGQVPSRCGVPI